MSTFDIPQIIIIKSETKIEREKEEGRRNLAALAKELSEVRERFRFPGINPDSYPGLKANDSLEGLCTPIDKLIERFKSEGMKVVLGEVPESGDAYILPFESNDVESDSIRPTQLQLDETMDGRLKKLIVAGRAWDAAYRRRGR